jgi:hypothetical protein
MKITITKSLVLGSLCLVSAISASADDRAVTFGRSRDPNIDYRPDSRYERHERVVVPAYRVPEARLRIDAVSRRDHALAHDYINSLAAGRALSPEGPAIDVKIRNGEVHLFGRVDSSDEHRALVRIAQQVPGVRNVQDELRGGGVYR